MKSEMAYTKEWFSQKTSKAFSSLSLWGYYLLAIVVFGNIGLWIAWGHVFHPDVLARGEALLAVISTIWALLGSSCADIVFSDEEKCIRAIPIFFAFLLIITTILALFPYRCMQYMFSFISFTIASFLWFLVNADKLKYNPNPMGNGAAPSGENHGVKTDDE